MLFFPILGGGCTSKRGTFGNVAKLDSMMCIAFGKSGDVAYTGGQNGNVYVWQGTTLAKTIKAHDGPCFAMHSLDKVREGCVWGGMVGEGGGQKKLKKKKRQAEGERREKG